MASSDTERRDPLLLYLEVPCVCNYDDYCTQFKSFWDVPEHYGLHRDTAHHVELSGLDSAEKAASFLQGWLFFAMLKQISSLFGVKFHATDFVVSAASRSPLIDSDLGWRTLVAGKEFSKYVWLWSATIPDRTLIERKACITEVKAHIDILHRVVNAWLEQDYVPITFALDRILLSIVLLGDSLTYAISKMFGGLEDETFNTRYRWHCSRHLSEQLIKVGWCQGELPLLLERCQPTVLLYLSSIERTRIDKDHSKCDNIKGCLVHRLDIETYQPSHAFGCPKNTACEMVQVSGQVISDIIESGSTPLIMVKVDSWDAIRIQIQSFKLDDKDKLPSYVAISHVWSDGMGNPKLNAVRSCQLRRIQTAVDALYDSKSGNHLATGIQTCPFPFWIDTLCVPLQPKTRSIAIARMAKTFFHAKKVLVMDNWLCSSRHSANPRDTLIKIAHSDWNTRLWTFHEAILAQECYFQFADGAIPIDELKDTATKNDNLKEVSNILSTIDKDVILREQSTLNLLWALTSIDPAGIETLEKYASLPVQMDPETEALRVHAVERRAAFERAWELSELWAPVLAQADIKSHNETGGTKHLIADRTTADLAEGLRTDIESRNFDPLLAHGLKALFGLRGIFYDISASRSDDLAGHAHRQLIGFDASPGVILQDVSRGLPERTTSRLEDETICLGGIIGLDVTPFLEIFVSESSRNKEALESVCTERMKRFLSRVKSFPSSILFWNTSRMAEYPWRWASRSLLDRNACVAMFSTYKAEITDQGLKARYRGIKIRLNETSAIRKGFRTLRLHFGDLRMTSYLESWTCVEIREPPTERVRSWCDFFSEEKGKDLALVTFGQQKLDGALVSILRTEQNVVFAKYLINVARVSSHTDPEYIESYVDAEPMGQRTWHVG